MAKQITNEIAIALRRGEFDYAETLKNMDLMRTSDSIPVRSERLTALQVEGNNFLIRKLRDAA